jgi:hypothetical protein
MNAISLPSFRAAPAQIDRTIKPQVDGERQRQFTVIVLKDRMFFFHDRRAAKNAAAVHEMTVVKARF